MDFDASGAKRVVDEIRREGGEAEISEVDLTDFQATCRAVDAIFCSTGRLGILVHSAGGFPRYISLLDIPIDDWDVVVDNKLKSMFYLLKVSVPLMIEGGYERIVTLSSAQQLGLAIIPPTILLLRQGFST